MTEASRENLVLIVEDDRDVRESILEVLEDNDYYALTASNGQEALDRLRSASPKPRVILLDMMMPVMDGRGFREAQRCDPELGAIPVVVLTAHASAEQMAREMQADAFLKKPVRLESLLELVERYCERQ